MRCCDAVAGFNTRPCSPRSTDSPMPTSLIVEGAGAQAGYRFKHALIQDAAYDSLLKSRRQALHRRAAEILRDSRARGGRAGTHRPSFHRGRPRRPRHRMVGQGGRPGLAPLGLPGGDRPSRQGDRNGGQGREGRARVAATPPRVSPQLQVAYGNALMLRAVTARRKRRKPSPEPELGVWRRGCARTIGGRLWLMGRQLRARRAGVDARDRRDVPATARGGPNRRSRRRTPQPWA